MGRDEFGTFVAFDDVATCLPVVQEVLQGFADERAYRLAPESMLALPMVESPLTVDLVEAAVSLYRTVPRGGWRRGGAYVAGTVQVSASSASLGPESGQL